MGTAELVIISSAMTKVEVFEVTGMLPSSHTKRSGMA